MGGREGILAYVFILLLLIFQIYLEEGVIRRLILTLCPLPLFCLADLVIPLTSLWQFYWRLLVSLPLLLCVVGVARFLGREAVELGLRASQLPFNALVALTGIPLGLLQHLSCPSRVLVVGLGPADILVPAFGFIVLALPSELLFRGLMQQEFGGVLGWWGLAYVSLMFGLTAGTPFSVSTLYGFAIGLYFTLAVRRTGSLAGVVLAHGIAAWEASLLFPGLL